MDKGVNLGSRRSVITTLADAGPGTSTKCLSLGNGGVRGPSLWRGFEPTYNRLRATRMSATCLTSLLCLLAAAQVRPIQEVAVPPKIEKFLKLCETSRRGAILQIEHTLRGLRRQSPATRETGQRNLLVSQSKG